MQYSEGKVSPSTKNMSKCVYPLQATQVSSTLTQKVPPPFIPETV